MKPVVRIQGLVEIGDEMRLQLKLTTKDAESNQAFGKAFKEFVAEQRKNLASTKSIVESSGRGCRGSRRTDRSNTQDQIDAGRFETVGTEIRNTLVTLSPSSFQPSLCLPRSATRSILQKLFFSCHATRSSRACDSRAVQWRDRGLRFNFTSVVGSRRLCIMPDDKLHHQPGSVSIPENSSDVETGPEIAPNVAKDVVPESLDGTVSEHPKNTPEQPKGETDPGRRGGTGHLGTRRVANPRLRSSSEAGSGWHGFGVSSRGIRMLRGGASHSR